MVRPERTTSDSTLATERVCSYCYHLLLYALTSSFSSGNGWVGWKNDSTPNGYVELIFEFDEIRNFSAAYFYANNFFSRNVQVSMFSYARLNSCLFELLVVLNYF